MPRHVEQLDVVRELGDCSERRVVAAECLDQPMVVGAGEVERLGLDALRAVVLAALEQVGALAATIVHPDEHGALLRCVLMDRPMRRDRRDAEVVLEVAHELERILAHAVALVDDGEDRHAAPAAHVEQLPRAFLDALAVVEQHDGAVGCDEHAIGVLAEVLVTRCVEQVHLVAQVLELQHRRGDGDAAFLLERHPVGGRVALRLARLDRAGLMDRTAVEQELLRERRLAGVGMRDDRKGPAPRDERVEGAGGSGGWGGHRRKITAGRSPTDRSR